MSDRYRRMRKHAKQHANKTKSNEAKQNDKPWLVVLFVVALLVNLLRAYTTLVKNDDVAIPCASRPQDRPQANRLTANAANAHGVGCTDFPHVGAISDDGCVAVLEYTLFD